MVLLINFEELPLESARELELELANNFAQHHFAVNINEATQQTSIMLNGAHKALYSHIIEFMGFYVE